MREDRELLAELRPRLKLRTDIPISEALAEVSAEDFVREFFALAEPFVAMWADLLALFERAAATTGRDQLDISFDFSGKSPELTFDLQHFRREIESVRELTSPFDLRQTDRTELWRVLKAFEPGYHLDTIRRSYWPRDLAAVDLSWEERLPEELPR